MGFYTRRILPHLLSAAMQQAMLRPYRERVAARAEGVVLEIGFGTGLNLPLYSHVDRVIGLDPSGELLSMAQPALARAGMPVELVEGSAEAIPLDARSIDTVVATWTLCSVPDVARALAEVKRVLVPSGRLVFVEHGRSPDAGVARWQDRLNPLWGVIAGGCHLNRPVGSLITEAGFRIEQMETGYMDGPRLLTFMYQGSARPY